MKIKYTKEDLDTDVDWLMGYGLQKEQAHNFIIGLLNKELEK